MPPSPFGAGPPRRSASVPASSSEPRSRRWPSWSPSTTNPADEQALAAAYEATRRLLRATTPREAVSAVSALVRQLGGTIVRPRHGDARVLDVDLSLGTGEPMAVAVEPYSVARLCLEEVLPAALSDARRVVVLLAGSTSGPEELADVDRP